jgi:hypothetical protein
MRENTFTDLLHPSCQSVWHRSWLSRALTDGLVLVVRRIGHCGYQTLLPLDCHVWGFMKNVAYEHKVNRREELHYQIFYAARWMNDPDVVHKVQIILNFKCVWLHNRWVVFWFSLFIFFPSAFTHPIVNSWLLWYVETKHRNVSSSILNEKCCKVNLCKLLVNYIIKQFCLYSIILSLIVRSEKYI